MALTQAETARISGISSSFMCDILHERKKPSALVAERLERVTKIDLRAWLMPEQYYNHYIHRIIGNNYSFIKSNHNKTLKPNRLKPSNKSNKTTTSNKEKGENSNELGDSNTKEKEV